jgi:hypothetical protein
LGEELNKIRGESFSLDKALAKKAVEMARPSIIKAIQQEIFKRKCLSICILDPKSGEVVYSEDIGKNETGHDFKKIARSKAKISYREKVDTLIVREQRTCFLEPGETTYQGGVYFRGYVVGVSGVEPWFDEMIALWIAAPLQALCRNELEQKGNVEFL